MSNLPTYHNIEYAKSGTSKCRGDIPCKGSFIPDGSLRYGSRTVSEAYGEGYIWRHWGCVTPQILQSLRAVNLDLVPGFKKLKAAEKKKVRAAIKAGVVARADVPATARPLDWSQGPPPSNPVAAPSGSQTTGQKRKIDVPESSQTNMPSSSAPHPQSQVTDLADSDEEFGNDPIEIAADELYLGLETQIVGVQYYKGLVGCGEEVNLVREPHNAYDSKAIQVINISGNQVGHIKRDIAAKLAPLIDARRVFVEGKIIDGNKTGFQYAISMTLNIYGPSDQRRGLEALLKWATPGQRGFTDAIRNRYKYGLAPVPPPPIPGPSGASGSKTGGGYGAPTKAKVTASHSSAAAKAATAAALAAEKERQAKFQAEAEARALAYAKAEELKNMINSFAKVDDEGRRSSLLDSLCTEEGFDVLALPEMENPPGKESGQLRTDLMRHQKQGLQWCMEHEYPKLPTRAGERVVQLWEYRAGGPQELVQKPHYYNTVARSPCPLTNPPPLGRGAIMGDSMGLGKTLTMISLIIATKGDNSPEFGKTTLIVAPVSVLRTWEVQIMEHCQENLLTYYTYHDKGREISTEELMKYDVIITSYSTCVIDYGKTPGAAGSSQPSKKKRKGFGSLYDISWKRVILNEGHTIRNPTTKQYAALCALRAERRWVVTGTPIINSPKDLGALLAFLRICRPLDDVQMYNRLLIRPLTQGSGEAALLLRSLMTQTCLRRTKEMQNSAGEYLVDLPPVEMTLVPVTLDAESRRMYDEVAALSTERFERFLDAQGNPSQIKIPMNALSMLTRMRQLALHPGLVPRRYLEELRLDFGEPGHDASPVAQVVSPAEKLRLQSILFQAIEDNEECPVCFDLFTDPRITTCAHVFCLPCIDGVIKTQALCPMDRRPISLESLIEPLPPTDSTQAQIRLDLKECEDEDVAQLHNGSSAKINELIHLLQLLPHDEKSVVFSQFTGFLDKIADQLSEHGIPFVRFDGSMSVSRRKDVLERFNIPLEAGTTPLPMSSSRPISKGAPKRQSKGIARVESDDDIPAPPTSGRAKRRVSTPKYTPTVNIDDILPPLPPSSGDEMDDLDNPVPHGPTRSRIRDGDGDFDPAGEPIEADDDNNADFGSAVGSGDDDFIDDDDESDTQKKGKGKGKAMSSKAKGKQRETLTATQRKKADRAAILKSYHFDDKIPVVMLISLKAGALGLQLTVANNIFLMDPWWQEGIESQAIDRCNRIGQKRNVHVFQLIAEDTVESKVLEIQEKKKALIKQAFSGTKSKETQRVKKEARLQDLMELFGVRRGTAASQAAGRSIVAALGEA